MVQLASHVHDNFKAQLYLHIIILDKIKVNIEYAERDRILYASFWIIINPTRP